MPLVDPKFEIAPNKVDSTRRSRDPSGTLGALAITPGHLALAGHAIGKDKGFLISKGALVATGRTLFRDRSIPITPGHLIATGKPIINQAVRWLTIPPQSIDRSGAYPKYIPNIKSTYLLDPGNSVSTVGLLPVFATFDASQRVGDIHNALPTIAEMATLVPGFTGYLPGDLYGQYDDITPYGAAIVTLRPFGDRTVDFVGVASGTNAYGIRSVGSPVAGTGQLTVPPPATYNPGDLLGIAAMSYGYFDDSIEDPADYIPAAQGPTTSVALWIKQAVAGETSRTLSFTVGANIKLAFSFAMTSAGGWQSAQTIVDQAPFVTNSVPGMRYTGIAVPDVNLAVLQVGARLLTTGDNATAVALSPGGWVNAGRAIQTSAVGAVLAAQFVAADLIGTTIPQNNVAITGVSSSGGVKGFTVLLRGSPALTNVAVTIPMQFIRNGITYPYDLVVTP